MPYLSIGLFVYERFYMDTGLKIKKARKLRNMTQAFLGELSGMSGERIRSYEAGNRTPKDAQIKSISDSLSIPPEYFTNHNIQTIEDAFMVLFELEELFGLSVTTLETKDSSGNSKTVYGLTSNDFAFNMYLMKWHDKREEFLNGAITKDEYDIWCARLKRSVEEDMQDDLHRKMIKQIEKDKKNKN